MSDERTSEEEERLAELLSLLPPAPEAWVERAARIPRREGAVPETGDETSPEVLARQREDLGGD